MPSFSLSALIEGMGVLVHACVMHCFRRALQAEIYPSSSARSFDEVTANSPKLATDQTLSIECRVADNLNWS